MRKYPALAPLVAVIAGIVMADQLYLPSIAGVIWAIVSALFALATWRSRPQVAGIFMLLALVGIGAAHFSHEFVDKGPRHLSNFTSPPSKQRIYGRVADWPDLKPERTEFAIDVDSIVADRMQPVQGMLLLKVSDTTTLLQRGDRVEFVGRLYPLIEQTNTTGFDYIRFVRLKGFSAIVYLPTLLNVRIDRQPGYALFSWVDNLRTAILDVFRRTLGERAKALAAGFLIGETKEIPPDIYRMFRDSGTMHLLAVSGSNVALVLLFALLALRPLGFSAKSGSWMMLGVITLFAMLSYGEPSVIRASLMASLVIGARALGRKIDLNNIIAITALAILMVSPTQLFDVGFQLSFMTAWGLIFIVPKLIKPLSKWNNRLWYKWLLFPVIISLVAQIVSTPIIVVYFQRVPLISVLANLLIVPLVSLSVISILVLLLAYLIWPIFGVAAGSLVNLLLESIVDILMALGGDNLPVINTNNIIGGSEVIWLAIVSYLLIALMAMAIEHKWARRMSMLITLCTIVIMLTSNVISFNKKDSTTIQLERVPGGIAAVIVTPGSSEGDLVLTGLISRDYPIDEKILSPLLDRLKISKLNSLFVLSADYDAFDDLLRLCEIHNADKLFLPQRYQAVIFDRLKQSEINFSLSKIEFFGSGSVNEKSPGWRAVGERLSLFHEGVSIEFVDRFSIENMNDRESKNPQILVTGRPLSLSPEEWIMLRELGIETIICSKIKSYSGNPERTVPESADIIPPDYLVDLSRLGSAGIVLGGNGNFRLK